MKINKVSTLKFERWPHPPCHSRIVCITTFLRQVTLASKPKLQQVDRTNRGQQMIWSGVRDRSGMISSMTMSNDGNRLYCGLASGIIEVW